MYSDEEAWVSDTEETQLHHSSVEPIQMEKEAKRVELELAKLSPSP